jgi:hypothetical protein
VSSFSFPLRGHRPRWPVSRWKLSGDSDTGASIVLQPKEIVLNLATANRDGQELPRALALSFASPDGSICVEARIPDPAAFLMDVKDAVVRLETGGYAPERDDRRVA